MTTKQEMITLLMNLRYDDDMLLGDPKRIKRNKVIDDIIFIVSDYLSNEARDRGEIDYDCPGGVCGTGGRV